MRYVIRHVVFVSLVRGYLDFTIYCNVFFEKNNIPLASLYYVHLFRLRQNGIYKCYVKYDELRLYAVHTFICMFISYQMYLLMFHNKKSLFHNKLSDSDGISFLSLYHVT